MHKQAEEILARIIASGEPPLETLPPMQARQIADRRVTQNNISAARMHEVQDLSCPGPAGSIRLRLYRPSDEPNAPLILFYHGGGFMVGNLDTHDALCRDIAAKAGATLIATDYRLAPEHRFPAAPSDCIAAADWILSNGNQLRVDTSRYAIVGESSGGNLTAVVTQYLRSRPVEPARLQAMIYPMLDMATDTPSYRRFEDGFFFTRRKALYFIDNYIDTEDDKLDPLAAPLQAESLIGLPPALIITAGLDPLLSEAERYAERLRASGVATEYLCLEHWPHGFMFWGHTDAYSAAMGALTKALRRALGAD